MNICVTVNSKYMRYTYVMLQALYEYHENESIDLYVLHRDFTDEDKNAIEEITKKFKNRVHFIWMDPSRFSDMPTQLIEGTTLSLEIFFRLLLPETLSMLDRVLLLDVDIVINGSLKELYDTNLEGVCLAAAPNLCTGRQVPEQYRSWYAADRTNWTHFNTGVLLWNLKYIREKYPAEYIFRKAGEWKIETMAFEEELFNVLFGEKEIRELDPFQWNYITTYKDIFQGTFQYHLNETEAELKANHKIIHFLARNPWGTGFKNESYRLWWECAEKTPYYHDLCKEQLEKTELCQPQEKLSLEYKTVILEKLLRLKGTGKLKELLEKSNICCIYLYGAGVMAELFYLALCSEQANDWVVGILDQRKQGKFYGMAIEGPTDNVLLKSKGMYGNNAYTIIITPSYETEEIKKKLVEIMPEEVRVITLKELLSTSC